MGRVKRLSRQSVSEFVSAVSPASSAAVSASETAGTETMQSTDASNVFEYEPDVKTVLERIMQSYLVGYVYSALVNSYSSEQSARMMAMDSANENASELLDHLELEYNHLRQNAITQEITEISSGARSLRNKNNV